MTQPRVGRQWLIIYQGGGLGVGYGFRPMDLVQREQWLTDIPQALDVLIKGAWWLFTRLRVMTGDPASVFAGGREKSAMTVGLSTQWAF